MMYLKYDFDQRLLGKPPDVFWLVTSLHNRINNKKVLPRGGGNELHPPLSFKGNMSSTFRTFKSFSRKKYIKNYELKSKINVLFIPSIQSVSSDQRRRPLLCLTALHHPGVCVCVCYNNDSIFLSQSAGPVTMHQANWRPVKVRSSSHNKGYRRQTRHQSSLNPGIKTSRCFCELIKIILRSSEASLKNPKPGGSDPLRQEAQAEPPIYWMIWILLDLKDLKFTIVLLNILVFL